MRAARLAHHSVTQRLCTAREVCEPSALTDCTRCAAQTLKLQALLLVKQPADTRASTLSHAGRMRPLPARSTAHTLTSVPRYPQWHVSALSYRSACGSGWSSGYQVAGKWTPTHEGHIPSPKPRARNQLLPCRPPPLQPASPHQRRLKSCGPRPSDGAVAAA